MSKWPAKHSSHTPREAKPLASTPTIRPPNCTVLPLGAPRRVPLVTQLTGILGQPGQLLSAVAMVALLHGPGWTPAFLAASRAGVVAAVAALADLRDAPAGVTLTPARAPGLSEVLDNLRAAWRHP